MPTLKTLTILFQKLQRSFATEATLKTHPYLLHRLDQPPLPEITLNRDEALKLYQQMRTIRSMEATLNQLYKAKIVRGFCHLYSGQEAVAVGAFSSLRPHDTLIATYRCHGWGFLYHDSVYPVIAELVGVQSGSVRGKGGSMHIYTKNMYGGNGIVGAHVPVGVGIALAHKYRNSDAVSLICYGEGASLNAHVYEAYNMAKLWELPCVFLVENNVYAMGTSINRSTKNPNVFAKGDLIPGIQADGMDVLSIKEATRYALEHIHCGKGPIIIEAQSYRYFGHSLSDPGTSYRTQTEIKHVRGTRDPITSFKRKIIEANLVTEEELTIVENKVKQLVSESVEKAKADKPVDVQELSQDVYANEVVYEVRGVNNYEMLKHTSSGQAWNLK